MKITTKSGFELEIDKEELNDYKVLDAIADADSDDEAEKIRGSVNLVRYILGKQKKAYYKHIEAQHNGRVPVEVVNEDVSDIFNQLNDSDDKEAKDVKNS